MTIPQELHNIVRKANVITVLTGAGVSAESGVPTFRDAQTGLWAQYRPEDLATPTAFARHPKLVWEWYAWRRELVGKASPNPAHLALARWQREHPHFNLITQNVDGLHQRAGSSGVIELHGNIHRTLCFREGTEVADWKEDGHIPPHCPRCGGPLRPGVVWFEEQLPEQALRDAEIATRNCDLFLSIGTSSVVYPAAGLISTALESQANVIEINPSPTPFTHRVHFALQGEAGRVLPILLGM